MDHGRTADLFATVVRIVQRLQAACGTGAEFPNIHTVDTVLALPIQMLFLLRETSRRNTMCFCICTPVSVQLLSVFDSMKDVYTRDSPPTIIWVILGFETAFASEESANIDPIFITVLALTIVELFLRSETSLSYVLDELLYHMLELACSREHQLTGNRLAVVVGVVGLRHDERLLTNCGCLLYV